ncbi:hypothetical protein [Campylobacter rectus]|nr:hypothetical protein [Campylobacter rectus]
MRRAGLRYVGKVARELRTARTVGRNLALSSGEIALLETCKIDRQTEIDN